MLDRIAKRAAERRRRNGSAHPVEIDMNQRRGGSGVAQVNLPLEVTERAQRWRGDRVDQLQDARLDILPGDALVDLGLVTYFFASKSSEEELRIARQRADSNPKLHQ